MDEESKKGADAQKQGNEAAGEIGERAPEAASFAETKRIAEEFEATVLHLIGEIANLYPEVTLRSWKRNYRLREGRWESGVTLSLYGPDRAVRAFLANLGVALNLPSIALTQPIDETTGRTFATPVKEFTAVIMDPKRHPNLTEISPAPMKTA